MLTFDAKNSMVNDRLHEKEEDSKKALESLLNHTGLGNEFLGWIDLPENYDREEFERIQKAADKIRQNSDVLVVIGIGGSYLGAKAVETAMAPYFPKEDSLEIIYAGYQLSSTYLYQLMDYLKEKEYSINVISKSGTTTEPAIAFRFLKEQIEEKYGIEGSKERIYVTTDREKGSLKTLSNEMGYETFVVPDDIGGRFSVLTAVGLLPIACSGVDIEALMQGAAEGRRKYTNLDFDHNIAMQYAAIRNLLYEDKSMEIMVNYEPKLIYFAEWFKQLYAESEGKDHKGLFPLSCNFTTDLHSVGQMIQDGQRNIFETVMEVENPQENLIIREDPRNLDKLNYLTGKDVDFVNRMAMEGTIQAHVEGDVPNLKIKIKEISAQALGEMIYFFEIAVAISGYMLGVNPFNQPGVEKYKAQMFKLLGKPGY